MASIKGSFSVDHANLEGCKNLLHGNIKIIFLSSTQKWSNCRKQSNIFLENLLVSSSWMLHLSYLKTTARVSLCIYRIVYIQ